MLTGKLELLRLDAEKFTGAHRDWIRGRADVDISDWQLPARFRRDGGVSGLRRERERERERMVTGLREREREQKSENVGQ